MGMGQTGNRKPIGNVAEDGTTTAAYTAVYGGTNTTKAQTILAGLLSYRKK